MQKAEPSVALYGSAAVNRGGTGVYTRRLIEGFKQAGIHGVTALGETGGSLLRKLYYENAALPHRVRHGGYDLVHLPAFAGRPPGGVPYAVTIHDMAFAACPGWFSPLRSVYYRLRFPYVARKAAVIIADSDFTVEEIKTYLGLSAARVYLAAPINRETDQHFRKTSGIQGRYILSTGTVEPRKNISALLEGWSEVRAAHPDLSLVIAGRWGWGDRDTKHQLGTTPGVKWLGEIPAGLLQSATSGADLVVYPSLYEGFGLPPLEAAAAGVPFALGPAAALREIYGSVAASFSDGSPRSTALSVLNALETKHFPDELRSFAEGFSMSSMARNTWQCYIKALQ